MKTLLLLRHAKSSKDDPSLIDFDRPLNERGKNDAQLIGKYIRQQKIKADFVVSSPAERARQTAELVLKSAGLEVELRFDKRIYEAAVRSLLNVVSQIEDTASAVVLVGHNPGFAELLEALTGEARDLPTASLACIELSLEKWSKAQADVGQLKWLVTPKKLRSD
ncbi:MAG: phosphohistidine phosphatase [Blastocatellia bacterium]|nr:phosphohistidine phosphatase [Blastocatellia bacterium]